MNPLTHAELKRLAGLELPAIVSLYIPHHAPRSHTAVGPATLRNLRHEAETRLVAHGWRTPDIQDLLQPVEALIENDKFWATPHAGVALFVGPELWELRTMHSSPESLVWVGKHAYLKPLWNELSSGTQFFLLAVNLHGTHLYRGDRYGVEPISVEHLPEGVRAALADHEHEAIQRSHSGHPGLPGKQSLVFHGQGGAADARKSEVVAYLREVDHAAHATIGQTDAPVVFVGVESLFPLYRDVATIRHLWPTPVHGNSEHWPLAELHTRAMSALEPWFTELDQRDRQRFESGRGGDRVSADLVEIVRAAHEGQVEAVFVASDVQMWGTFHPQSGMVELVDRPQGTNEDLLDRIASHTFLNGGRVHAVPAADVPEGLVVAAIYRYPRVSTPAS